MTAWNRSYLEAINIPVWVSRQDVAAKFATKQVETEVATKPEPQVVEAPVEQTTAFGFVYVAGDVQAKTCIIVTAEQDLQQVKSNFRLLTQAWKQWQNTDFPLALLQLVEQQHSTTTTEPITELKGKQLLLSSYQTIDLAPFKVKAVPSLNWQSANDKKAWWQLLQSLA